MSQREVRDIEVQKRQNDIARINVLGHLEALEAEPELGAVTGNIIYSGRSKMSSHPMRHGSYFAMACMDRCRVVSTRELQHSDKRVKIGIIGTASQLCLFIGRATT
jgi:hypothetical protein